MAISLVATMALVASACGSDKKSGTKSGGSSTTAAKNNDRGNVDGQLVLGALLPQSGDLSAIIKSLITPIQMAVDGDQRRRRRERQGRRASSRPTTARAPTSRPARSTRCSPPTRSTSSSARRRRRPRSASSTRSRPTASSSARARTPRPSSRSPAAPAGGYYFRTAPSDNLQGPALAQLILSDNKRKVAILTRNDSYGTGFGNVVVEGADRRRRRRRRRTSAYDPKASDFKADVAKVAGKGADAIVVLGFNDDGGKVLKEMIAQNLGPKNVQIYTADGMQSSSFYKGVDPSNPAVIEGIKGTAPAAAPSGVTHPFTAEFAKTGVDTIFSSYYYDCTNLIALAAQAAGSDDPAKIKDKIIEVSSRRHEVPDLQGLLRPR